MPMRIALHQIRSTPDPSANLEVLRRRTGEAAEAGARLVVFPEATMCCFGVPLGPVAEPLDGPWAEGVRAVARESGVVVVAGMFTPAGDGRVTNTLLATGAGVEARYDKIHLYDAFGFAESRTVAAGSEVVTVEVDGVRVGLATCYDVRFPELFRAHADAGAVLTVLPASWGAGVGKREQWEVLTRARSLDATVWVAAVGQAGDGGDAAAAGGVAGGSGAVGAAAVGSGAPLGIGYSVLVGPDGRVRKALGAEPGVLIGEVDAAEVDEVRTQIPVLANRRLQRGSECWRVDADAASKFRVDADAVSPPGRGR